METKANYVAVGAFVLACVIGLVVTILWLAGAQYSQEYAYYQTFFKGPVTGLGKGTITRYNGIEVGRVTDLVFDPNDPQSVIVTLQVQPNLSIREDSVASIESQGLTGASYVEISGGTKTRRCWWPSPASDIRVIRAKQSTLQQLEQSAPEVVAKLNVAASRLNDLLSDNNRRAVDPYPGESGPDHRDDCQALGRYRRHPAERQHGHRQSARGLQRSQTHPRPCRS